MTHDMIPQEKSAAVTQGLREAFGVETCEDIHLLTKGAGPALVFRIVVGGSPYLLRIIIRASPQNDPSRQFTFMKAAGDVGVAPRVRYFSIDDAICITDFVQGVPFPANEALIRIPRVLRTLHALTPYPKALNYVTVDASIRKFQAANLLPKDEIDEIFARYAELSAVYPRLDSDMVSCHNDAKPENLLFDGNRTWLVGWKAAFTNDRYFDLAVVADFVITNDAEENVFLQEYFGQPADEYQRARFYLMRQIIHMLSAAFYLLFGAGGKPVNRSEKLPSFRDFHEHLWAGELSLADNDVRVVCARLHWELLLHNTRQARFDEALRIVSDRDTDVPRLLLSSPAQ